MATVQRKKSLVAMAIAVSALCSGASRADADTYIQTNLASDITGLATVTDPLLVNTWGLVGSAAGSPFWISKGHQYIHSLCGDRRHKRQQGDGRCSGGTGRVELQIAGPRQWNCGQPPNVLPLKKGVQHVQESGHSGTHGSGWI